MAGLCTHLSTEDATGKPTAAVEGHNALLLLIPVDIVSSLTEEDSDWLLSMVVIVVSEWHKKCYNFFSIYLRPCNLCYIYCCR